jgi:hypothetical protein
MGKNFKVWVLVRFEKNLKILYQLFRTCDGSPTKCHKRRMDKTSNDKTSNGTQCRMPKCRMRQNVEQTKYRMGQNAEETKCRKY